MTEHQREINQEIQAIRDSDFGKEHREDVVDQRHTTKGTKEKPSDHPSAKRKDK